MVLSSIFLRRSAIFILAQEEQSIVKHVYAADHAWVQLNNRRLQQWGGCLFLFGHYSDLLPRCELKPPFFVIVS